MYERLSALIIEPNASKRSYLWQATLSEPQFSRVKGMKSLGDTLAFLAERSIDVILISACFSKNKVVEFIEHARALQGGKESAYVSVVPTAEQTNENIAMDLLGGLDGFLFVPFSVHSLKQVAKIASRVKKRFEADKKKAALTLLIPPLAKCLDNYAVATMIQSKMTIEKKEELLESFGSVRSIALEFRDDYINILTEQFENCPPRTLPTYEGASERVRMMYEKTLKKVL